MVEGACVRGEKINTAIASAGCTLISHIVPWEVTALVLKVSNSTGLE